MRQDLSSKHPATSNGVGLGGIRMIWLLLILFLIPLIGFIHRLVINILIDPISIEFSISDTQSSLLQGPPFAIVYGLMVIPMGLLADRKNRVLLLSGGAFIWSLGTLMCGLAPTFTSLFIARMAVGLGEAALVPAVVSLIGDSFAKHRRGIAMGIFFVGINAGFSTAYAVGGYILELAEAGAFESIAFIGEFSPWRQVFLLLSIPGLLLPVLLLTIKEPGRQDTLQHDGILRTLQELFLSKPISIVLILLMAQAGILAVADNGIYAWLPRLLSRGYQLEATEIGVMLGIIVAIAGAIAGPISGALSDFFVKRKGSSGPLVVILIAVAIAMLAAPLFALGSLFFVYVATALWVTALVAASTTTFTFISVATPDRFRGIAASLVTSTIALVGLGLGPTVIALTMQFFELSKEKVDMAILLSVLPICCLAFAIIILLMRMLNRPQIS